MERQYSADRQKIYADQRLEITTLDRLPVFIVDFSVRTTIIFHTTVIFLTSKQILRAHVFSEQVVVF